MIHLGTITLEDIAAIGAARQRIRALAGAMGLQAGPATLLATAVSELGRALAHAGHPAASDAPLLLSVHLDSDGAAPALRLVFTGARDTTALGRDARRIAAALPGDHVTVHDRACTVSHPVPSAAGTQPAGERVAAWRALIQARSRGQLMHELAAKNRELARREAQLAARLRQIETVAYVTTHDLRGGADQAQYGADELAAILDELPPELAEHHGLRDIVANIQAATGQQVALLGGIEPIVELWRQDAVVPVPIDCNPLLGDRLARLDRVARHAVHIDDLGVVHGDPDMFVAIVLHLIDNAVTYNDKPVKRVWVYRTGDRIHVRDNGNGIPADKLGQVMRAFQRLDTGRAGMGVGLALCEAMAARHGWTLTAVSQVGAGTTFTINMEPPDERATAPGDPVHGRAEPVTSVQRNHL